MYFKVLYVPIWQCAKTLAKSTQDHFIKDLPLNPGEPGDRLSGDNPISEPGDFLCLNIGDDGLRLELFFKMKCCTAFMGPCLDCGGEFGRRILCVDVGPCPDILLQTI